MKKVSTTAVVALAMVGGSTWAGFEVPDHVKSVSEMDAALAEAWEEGMSVMMVRSDPGTT